MLNRKIIVSSNFNAWKAKEALESRLTKEWIENRIKVFMSHTLQSLKIQISQDFLALIIYDELSHGILQEILAQYDELPVNVHFVTTKKYDEMLRNYIDESDHFFLIRIDSDDMYHNSYIQQLQEYRPQESTIALINQDGYIYDSIQHRLAYWSHPSPPFYTLIYKTQEYLTGKRYKLPGGHSKIIQFDHEILKSGNFVVVVHSNNISTHFNKSQRKEIITDPDLLESILKEFKG